MDIHTTSKKHAGNFMTVLGVAADITAVAALAFNKDFKVFIQIASIAGIAVGIYLLLRQWGKPVGLRVILAVVCITAGFVVGALSMQARGVPSSNDKTSDGTSTTSTMPSIVSDAQVAFQFRLKPFTGINIDAGKRAQSDVVDSDGPNGDVDIFMDQFGYLEVNGGAFYTDAGGPDNEIHSRCTRVLTAQRDPHPEILPIKAVRACFKTSGGKTAWLLSNDASFNGEPYAVLNIKVW